MADTDKVTGLGARIREIRERNHWTQEQVGPWCGMSGNMIAQFELERSLPNADNLAKLAKGLRVTSDWLLGIEV